LLLFFSLTLFVSATLLFLVQPMIGKMILPQLGGTPAVWNTCMVFFQMILLVGYGYTHTLSTALPTRRQLVAQGLLLFLPFLVLPFALGDWAPPTESNPVFAVLWLLLGLVGLPFFVVSTSAPLLQKWFAHTGHPASKDPYFLYGASNLGSMLALVLYPTVVEPNWEVADQAKLWMFGYAIFVALVLGCAVIVWRCGPAQGIAAAQDPLPEPLPAQAPPPETATAVTAGNPRKVRLQAAPESLAPPPDLDRITLGRRLRWIGLAAAPSSLMLGVTTYLTTDIAAIPFFWVLPLALYLMTFILVFAKWPTVWTEQPHSVVLVAQPFVLMLLVLKMTGHLSISTWMEFTLHLSAFLLTTLMCHGELAKDRPSAKHLTEFYLWMSFGGMLGGMFNALVAPLALKWGILEYGLAMAVGCMLRPNLVIDKEVPIIPGDSKADKPTLVGYILDYGMWIAVGLAALGGVYAAEYLLRGDITAYVKRPIVIAVCSILVLTAFQRPLRFGLSIVALFLAMVIYDRTTENLVYIDRGFFGLLRVRETEVDHQLRDKYGTGEEEAKSPWVRKTYRTLVHGGIDHGREIVKVVDSQMRSDDGLNRKIRRDPITYFHPLNGVGEAYAKFSWPDHRLPASLVGMGTSPIAAVTGLLVDMHSEPPYAVLGLGTGILASYARPYQTMDFYEIDPLVRDLSLPKNGKDPVFYYVQDAKDRGANIDVKMGDGRLKIKEAPENYYHIISLDAFSSDAIPVHLLTAEAVDLYMSKLAEGGILIFNTTNRYVRIEPVLSAIAKAKGYDCLACPDYRYDEDPPDRYGADWLVMQRRVTKDYANGGPPIDVRFKKGQRRERVHADGTKVRNANGEILTAPRWDAVEPLPGPVWTDGYSNLLKIMRWTQ
jgi:hypothetical protein